MPQFKVVVTQMNTSVPKKVVKTFVVAPFQVPNGIPVSTIQAEGDIIVGQAPGVGMRLAAPTASNLTLISDLTVAGKWKLGSGGGGGGVIALKNNDSSIAYLGSVVCADLSVDTAFKGSVIPNDMSAIGVTAADINIGSTGNVTIAGLNTVLVSGNVNRGEWLVNSATRWMAKTAGMSWPMWGALGYAMTNYAGGGNGTVQAVVMPNPFHLSSAGTAWAIAGYNAGGNTADGQKFIVASDTWGVVAGAAITTAVRDPSAWVMGQSQGTRSAVVRPRRLSQPIRCHLRRKRRRLKVRRIYR